MGDQVYGLMYEISVKDEEVLDKCECVPDEYVKKVMPLELITPSNNGGTTTETVDALIYIDVVRTKPGRPRTEYIYRMNMATKDALVRGVPQSYIDTYIRPFIPPE
jgi:gamma-glutamylcyclotransferase